MRNFTLLFLILIISINAQKQFNFFISDSYNRQIKTPKDYLGFANGERPIRYSESIDYLKYLAAGSDRVDIGKHLATHQGRELYYLIVSSEENQKNISGIKERINKLSEPRTTKESALNDIVNGTPAVAMMMYSIHGNELSGADASIQLAYQLAAGNDDRTKQLLDNLVIIIYPMENPDGRERFLSQAEQWTGDVKTDDVQSMPHSGTWPTGRTNHYHFDLNRDWFILSQPESRSRVDLLMEWKPQFVVDAHEMGSYGTFLFNPPREPINPYLDNKIREWWKTFAKDQADALDEYGWSYYTREWLEDWFPGYGSSYPSYFGAVSILYEQARTAGLNVKKPEGTTLTYEESVQHQFLSSIANLTTAAKNKNELMKTYYEIRKESLTPFHPKGVKAYLVEIKNNKTRADSMMKVLTAQGIEVFAAEEAFSLNNVKNYFDDKTGSRKFDKGTFIIPLAQPNQHLINAVFDFDTRLSTAFLKEERESIEKGEGTRLYEVTSWSLPLAYDVSAYESYSDISVKMKPADFSETKGLLTNSNPKYGFLIDYTDDKAVDLLIDLLDKDFKVRSARKVFKVENKEYKRGTLLIRIEENKSGIESELRILAEKHGVDITGVNTALSQAGADLGGGEFELLQQPKTALFAGSYSSVYNFGTMWYLLDHNLGLKTSVLNLDYFERYDLRKYNVIIMPSVWGSMKNSFSKSAQKKLTDWISDGGTLIAVEGAAAFLADSSIGISSVKLRSQNLDKLYDYLQAVEDEEAISKIEIDSAKIWSNEKLNFDSVDNEKSKLDEKEEKKRDAEFRKFMPQGSILNAKLNEEHWLNFGLSNRLPVFYSSGYSFLSKPPVQTAARLEDEENIRLSGLLWPEAKYRLANSAYCTREGKGNGQIILFADEPFFRAYFHGTARMLLNAILLGPGFGTSQSVDF